MKPPDPFLTDEESTILTSETESTRKRSSRVPTRNQSMIWYVYSAPTNPTLPSPFSPLDPCNRHLWEAGMGIRGRETFCAFTFLYVYAAALAGASGLSFEDWCYPERKIHFNSRGVAVKADLDLFLDWDFPVWAPTPSRCFHGWLYGRQKKTRMKHPLLQQHQSTHDPSR